MSPTVKQINFQDFMDMGYHRFESRSSAIALKSLVSIDAVDFSLNYFEVYIPDNLHSINTLFASEFFESLILYSGSSQRFYENVKILGANYSVQSIIDRSVHQLLNEEYA